MPKRAGDRGHLVDALRTRIGAHAVREPGEVGEVVLDLACIDMGVFIERGLVGCKRRVGDALDAAGIGRRQRNGVRPAEEPPGDGDDGRGSGKKSDNPAHGSKGEPGWRAAANLMQFPPLAMRHGASPGV